MKVQRSILLNWIPFIPSSVLSASINLICFENTLVKSNNQNPCFYKFILRSVKHSLNSIDLKVPLNLHFSKYKSTRWRLTILMKFNSVITCCWDNYPSINSRDLSQVCNLSSFMRIERFHDWPKIIEYLNLSSRVSNNDSFHARVKGNFSDFNIFFNWSHISIYSL